MPGPDFINRNIEEQCRENALVAYEQIYRIRKETPIGRWVIGILLLLLVILLLPWTQHITAEGSVTGLRQEQRPQQLNTIIAGRVVKWHIKEGDFVKAGDTLVQLAEIKDDYLDPLLLQRTGEQVKAKKEALENYRGKVSATGDQIRALYQARDIKLSDVQNKIRQQRLKITSDSMEWQSAINDFTIKANQFQRQKVLFDSGLVSLTQLELRNQAYQDALSKKMAAEIKFNNARNEFIRLQLEWNGERQQYQEKIAKAEGDRFQSVSEIRSGEADLAKLENQYMNYNIRSSLYFIQAPQDGQVVKAKKAGIGEVVKDGETIVEIVPAEIDYAVEIFIRPVDLPLLSTGQRLRFTFDGYPAIVFSGWPRASYGTFGGVVAAIESSVSQNGMFRVLVRQDEDDKPWPRELRVGTGARGIALLKRVQVWYELWRNINGFPPDFYQTGSNREKQNKGGIGQYKKPGT